MEAVTIQFQLGFVCSGVNRHSADGICHDVLIYWLLNAHRLTSTLGPIEIDRDSTYWKVKSESYTLRF